MPSIEAASDHSLLVRWSSTIDEDSHARVRALFESLDRNPLAGVVNRHPAYSSLLIDYDPLRADPAELTEQLHQRAETSATPKEEGRLVEIPVCYGGEYGPDLNAVAEHTGLSTAEVIARHSAAEHLVYFLGFSPGFPYLDGMDASLATPRLASPRRRVEAGSVGIAGNQTGVYPLASPGGWRIIGRTPLRLFDSHRDPAALLQMGDHIRFRPIGSAEFDEVQSSP